MLSPEIESLLMEPRHDFNSLVRIMALLRSEGGCPWDREQTHQSIRANLIEETYEVVEAIDREDPVLMREELGDALLQVVFHACISEEAGEFSMDDVVHDICEKLIHRHPHIFAHGEGGSAAQVLDTWEKIKTEEKQRVGLSGSLAAVPPALPALMRAQKCVKKAAKAGVRIDLPDAARQVSDAAVELARHTEDADPSAAADEIQRVLFSTAAIAQYMNLDAEELLTRRTDRFISDLTKEEAEGDCADWDDCRREEAAERAFDKKN